MKEDVLEQIVEDHLQSLGYLTRHNLKFKPRFDHENYIRQQDAVHSDIDVIGIAPHKVGPERVWVVSCKSWQAGFDPVAMLDALHGNKKTGGREAWKSLRELWVPKWNESFREAVYHATGERQFHYSIAVTRLNRKQSPEQAADLWINDPIIASRLEDCEFSFLTMRDMWASLQESVTTTVSGSDIGRLAQLLKAAGVTA
ncbi:MAG: hypothetical protein ACOH1T_00120 [Microbacteriaceae bacterium]